MGKRHNGGLTEQEERASKNEDGHLLRENQKATRDSVSH